MKLIELYEALGVIIEQQPRLAEKEVLMEIVSPYTEISSGETLSSEIDSVETSTGVFAQVSLIGNG